MRTPPRSKTTAVIRGSIVPEASATVARPAGDSGIGHAGCKNGLVDDEPGTTLTLDDLVLRPWRPADAPAVFAVCQDPEIARWVTIPQPFGLADAEAFIETARAMWRDGTGAAFAIVDAATGRI